MNTSHEEPEDWETFSEEEILELQEAFDKIFSGEERGYELVFWISHNAAEELVDAYRNATENDDEQDITRCMTELGKIVNQLEDAVRLEND